jgi:hypothetical protein
MSIEIVALTAASKIAVDAIYYATRLIRHRTLWGSKRGLVVEGSDNEPSPEAQTLAKKLIREIEQEEHAPLEKLDDETVSQITGRLEQLLKQRYTEGASIDGDRGEELLKELRELPLR